MVQASAMRMMVRIEARRHKALFLSAIQSWHQGQLAAAQLRDLESAEAMLTAQVVFAGVMGKWVNAPIRALFIDWRKNAADEGRKVGLRSRVALRARRATAKW